MFRLAHISDIHLGPLPAVTRRELLSKRITGYINWQRNRSSGMGGETLVALVDHLKCQRVDHIAVTGDLVNLALDQELENAREWLTELGEAENVSVVPGNHDTYVGGALKKIRSEWREWMCGDREETSKFPYLRVRDGVALIGVNSGRATAPFMATGSFREKQARRLAGILDEAHERGLFRIIMIHHPPQKNATARHKRLIGANRFRKILKRHGAELVLHGHTHLPTQVTLPGAHGDVPVFGVASASQSPVSNGAHLKPPANYTIFEIERHQEQWVCNFTRFGFQSEGVKIVQLAPKEPIS